MPRQNKAPSEQLTAHLFRENSGKMVAVLSKIYGIHHLDLILDAVQDTFETALSQWRFSGVPENPPAWLMRVARNKALNAIQRAGKTTPLLSCEDQKYPEWQKDPDLNAVTDSQLQLLLACCQPELSVRNQIIITLYTLCGFGVPEIANGLLMHTEAVKKALTRSKSALKSNPDIFRQQPHHKLSQHLDTVQTILYLLFNEGYKSTRSDQGINKDLCYEAIRLMRIVQDYAPFDTASRALLALMFFNISRFPARITSDEWLSLEEQERNLWDATFIREGFIYLKQASSGPILSRFHIEAMIASIHCTAPEFEQTDWEKIVQLYKMLESTHPESFSIKINRIIAESYLSPPDPLIRELLRLETNTGTAYHFQLLTTLGHLYKKADFLTDAVIAYTRSLEYAQSAMDQAFIKKMISQCT